MAKTKEYVVVHKNLNLAVMGKIQKLPVGAILTLEHDRAKGMLKKGWITDPSTAKKIKVGGTVTDEAAPQD